jgi:cellobiose PTS system EIIB component
MRKIKLFCAGGLSTSLLVNKMKAAALADGYEVEITAHPTIELELKGGDADIILLGPQVRTTLSDIAVKFPGKKAMVVDMVAYGMIDGKTILAQAKKLLGD